MDQSRVISHARGYLCVLHFARRTTEKRETARSLIQTKSNIPSPIKHHNFTPGFLDLLIIKTNLLFSRWFETSWFHHICCPNEWFSSNRISRFCAQDSGIARGQTLRVATKKCMASSCFSVKSSVFGHRMPHFAVILWETEVTNVGTLKFQVSMWLMR